MKYIEYKSRNDSKIYKIETQGNKVKSIEAMGSNAGANFIPDFVEEYARNHGLTIAPIVQHIGNFTFEGR